DAGDRVVGLVAQLAVVGDADVDAVGEAGVGGPPARQRRLRLGERDPGDLHAVLARGVQREAAPATADVEDALARLPAELGADELELRALRVLERLGAARPDRARVRQRRVEHRPGARV